MRVWTVDFGIVVDIGMVKDGGGEWIEREFVRQSVGRRRILEIGIAWVVGAETLVIDYPELVFRSGISSSSFEQ